MGYELLKWDKVLRELVIQGCQLYKVGSSKKRNLPEKRTVKKLFLAVFFPWWIGNL